MGDMACSLYSRNGNGNELRKPYSEELDDGIFEIRAKVGSDITRLERGTGNTCWGCVIMT